MLPTKILKPYFAMVWSNFYKHNQFTFGLMVNQLNG